MPYPAHKPADVFDHIRVTDSDCWEWTGLRARGGYGRFEIKDRVYLAHKEGLDV